MKASGPGSSDPPVSPQYSVSSMGELVFKHRQSGKEVVFRGQLSPDSRFALLTRDQATGFVPGTLVLVRAGGGSFLKSHAKGSYTVGHLNYVKGSGGKAVAGAISLDGTGKIPASGSTLSVLTPPTGTNNITGTKYGVTNGGTLYAEIKDQGGTEWHNGNMLIPLKGVLTSEAAFTTAATSYDYSSARPKSGSLMVWIQRF